MDRVGQGEGLPGRLDPDIDVEASFPNLSSYEVTSRYNINYNCIAYAVGDEYQWWDPFPHLYPNKHVYWPRGVKRSYHISALQSAYKTKGFEICTDGKPEVGYQKVALYANNKNNFTHAAKQLDDGSWRSKIGRYEDIEHKRAEDLNGGDYGDVFCFMKRPIGDGNNSEEKEPKRRERFQPSVKNRPLHIPLEFDKALKVC